MLHVITMSYIYKHKGLDKSGPWLIKYPAWTQQINQVAIHSVQTWYWMSIARFHETIPCFDETVPCFIEMVPCLMKQYPVSLNGTLFWWNGTCFDEMVPCFNETVPCFNESVLKSTWSTGATSGWALRTWRLQTKEQQVEQLAGASR